MYYIMGDIHGDTDKVFNFVDSQLLQSEDVIVLLGDVGINYFGNKYGDKYKKSFLNALGIKLFCIHGNHEMRPQNLSYYNESIWNGGTVFVEKNYPNILFAKDGELYDFDGIGVLAIGGAYSVDKYVRISKGWAWFPDEQPSEMTKRYVEKRIKSIHHTVDVVLSHTCPMKYIPTEAFLPNVDQLNVDNSTEMWLDSIENSLNYQHWYCGHWHIDKTIDKIHFVMNSVRLLNNDVDKR